MWDLLQEIEVVCGPGRIRMLDIGGGLSVDYSTDQPPQVWHQCRDHPSLCCCLGLEALKHCFQVVSATAEPC